MFSSVPTLVCAFCLARSLSSLPLGWFAFAARSCIQSDFSPALWWRNALTSAALAAAFLASSLSPVLDPPKVWPWPVILGTPARGADCEGGVEPTVRPGCEKGSDSLEGLPQRFPIVAMYEVEPGAAGALVAVRKMWLPCSEVLRGFVGKPVQWSCSA